MFAEPCYGHWGHHGGRYGRHYYHHHRYVDAVDSVCPVRRYPCHKDCGSYGYMRDENGCELCACNVPDSPRCPALDCPNGAYGFCPYGRARDDNGCPLCECRPNPRCQAGAAPRCRNYCPDGYAIGSDGCPTCQCYDPDVQSSDEGDIVSDESNGSVRVRRISRAVDDADESANEKVCPMCMMYCPNGMKTGPDGCPLCECNDVPPGNATATNDERPGRRPGGRRGSGGREGGGRRGDGGRGGGRRGGRGRGRGGRGEGRRRVGQPSCMQPTCAMFCPNGFRRDANGCTLCECQTPEDLPIQLPTTAPGLQCPRLRCHRRKNCAHGFAVDATNGCASCVCRSLPVVVDTDETATTSA